MDNENQNENHDYLGITSHSPVETTLIKLVSILSSVNSPTNLLEKIVKWAKEIDADVLNARPISYKALIHRILTIDIYGSI